MARPTKLTAELTAEVVDAIEAGNYAETAAEAVGITPATFYNWMTWGAQSREPYTAFFEAITCARARAEMQLVSTVLQGDDKGTGFGAAKAAAFMLERTRPKKFAQRINVKVQDELERLLDVVQRVCSESDFSRILEAIAAGDSETPAGDADIAEGGGVH